MKHKNFLVERRGNIALIKINRPEKLNSMNKEALIELKEILLALGKDREVRAIVITGSGEKAFCAGADVKEMMKMTPMEALEFSKLGIEVTELIEQMGKPVIAAVNGFALGGGNELALACDVRLASENAKFGQPEVKLGIMPGWGGTQRLIKAVGPGKAKKLIFSGETIDAQTAERIGLVDMVVEKGDLLKEAIDLANSFASNAPLAVSLAKKAVNSSFNLGIRDGCELEAQLFSLCFNTADHAEGLSAFIEKRKPVFKGE